MFDILFSLKFVWIMLVIIMTSTALAWLCLLLHRQLLFSSVGLWLSEHIYCPVGHVLQLMLMAFLLFPLMFPVVDYAALSQLFLQPRFLSNMLNILFVAGLVFSFLPFLSHASIGMPLLGCIATGLIYLHQIAIPQQLAFDGFPPPFGIIKILLLMLALHWLTRWLNRSLAQWVDLKLMVSDSKNLISDINALIFQIPIILAYGQSLVVSRV